MQITSLYTHLYSQSVGDNDMVQSDWTVTIVLAEQSLQPNYPTKCDSWATPN